MAIYNTNRAGIAKWLPDSSGVNVVGIYTFPASGAAVLNAGDTFVGPSVAANTWLVDFALDVDQLDTGGAITLNVGWAASPAAIVSATTLARTGGYLNSNTHGWLGTFFTVNTPIIATVANGGSGAPLANAGVRMYVVYSADA